MYCNAGSIKSELLVVPATPTSNHTYQDGAIVKVSILVYPLLVYSIQSELPVCPAIPPSNQTYQHGAIVKVSILV